MLGKSLWLVLASLIVSVALSACSSVNTSAVAIPVWDDEAAATAQ